MTGEVIGVNTAIIQGLRESASPSRSTSAKPIVQELLGAPAASCAR